MATDTAWSSLGGSLKSIGETAPIAMDMLKRGKFKLLKTFLGPAYDGLVLKKGKQTQRSFMQADHDICYDWTYAKGRNPQIDRLYEAGKAASRYRQTDYPG
ncbi:MAG TPA: hypothetical protein PKC98_13090 [Candidatus Melainabacteria bacterium]|nr:hypothetical protein [Candidatus Melainabacteria bacterium]